MSEKTYKAALWLTGTFAAVAIVLFIIMTVSLARDGLSDGVGHLKDQASVGLNGGNLKSEGEFLGNRNFERMPRVVTPINRSTVLGEGEIDLFEISIEGVYSAKCFAERAEVYGPFGVILDFNKGEKVDNYPELASEIETREQLRVYSVTESGSQKKYHTVDLSRSFVYFEKENGDGSYSVISELKGETWTHLAQNGWIAYFKEQSGDLMMECGHYRIVMVTEHKIFSGDGVNTMNKMQIYDIFANDGMHHQGLMQKLGSQDDYKFQLNCCGGEEALIYPESKKLTVTEGQTFGVFCSAEAPAENAVFYLYYLDAKSNSYVKIYEQALFDGGDREQKDLVCPDFGDKGSGTYKIVLEGEFKSGAFGKEAVSEEYEYYFVIGELS